MKEGKTARVQRLIMKKRKGKKKRLVEIFIAEEIDQNSGSVAVKNFDRYRRYNVREGSHSRNDRGRQILTSKPVVGCPDVQRGVHNS